MMKTFVRVTVLFLGLAFLGVVMAWLAGMFSKTQEPGRVAPALILGEGSTATAEALTVPLLEQTPGTLQARDETSISSRITARVETVHVRASDHVEAGDVLITLDDRDLQARLEQTRRQVESAEAVLEETRSEYERTQVLFGEGAVAKARLDNAEAAYQSARAELMRTRQSVNEAEASLSHAVLAAPLAGRVIDRYVEPGDLASLGKVMVRLYDPESLRLEADVRESLAVNMKRGDKMQVVIDSIDATLPAEIEEIVPHSDPASRSFLVKASVKEGENLYPGMFGRLLIPAGAEKRVYISPEAVFQVGQLRYVLVEQDGVANRRFIRTGVQDENGIEVLSGLSEGESLLLNAL